MFDEPFRRRVAPVLDRVAAPLARRGVSPNHITILACALALGAAALVATGSPRAGIALWLVSRVGDGLDGALARHRQQSSAFGGYLDITLDMTAYAAMVVGFAVTAPALWLAWLAVMAGYVLVITTTLALSDAARASTRPLSDTNRTFQFTTGLTEAGETNVMYTLWALLPGQLEWLVWAWAAALAVTAVQRTALAARVLR
jgi:phosphatidylglycerophosphate synthase